MPFQLFQKENLAQGLPLNGQFKAGISDIDAAGTQMERGVLIPYARNPEATWIYYDVGIECHLDSGIVVHRHLPQVNNIADTLASFNITDPDTDKITGRGVNTISKDKFSDVVQRMAHAQYWFRLSGQAMRIGFQVPIPGLKTVGGVTAIPYDDQNAQFAYNKIVGNYSGVILWRAAWSLWYTVAQPPMAQQLPPRNLAAHISADDPLPKDGIQSPQSQPDDEALPSIPVQLRNPLG